MFLHAGSTNPFSASRRASQGQCVSPRAARCVDSLGHKTADSARTDVLQAQMPPQQEAPMASTKEATKVTGSKSSYAVAQGAGNLSGKEQCLETPLDGNNNHQGVIFDVIALEHDLELLKLVRG